MMRRTALKVHSRLYGSYLYVFIDANVRRRLYRLGVLRDRMDQGRGAVFTYAFDEPGVDLEEVEAAYHDYAQHLSVIKRLLDERGIPMLALGLPSRFRISDEPVDNERGFDTAKIRIDPYDRMAQYCRELGIPFVDLRLRLRKERQAMLDGDKPWNDLYIPYDYSHLDPAGLGMAAEMLRAEIDRQGWLRQGN